ncbi:MAG: hypothetical protein GX295_00925 [Syntrophomonadaceae bacterium]|nr:hypothetical protein [Syntrophomonadaceae bacterium]
MNDKQIVQSLISRLEGSADDIRNSMKEIYNGEALTELTQALLKVDDGARQCRAALRNLDEEFDQESFTIEPFE